MQKSKRLAYSDKCTTLNSLTSLWFPNVSFFFLGFCRIFLRFLQKSVFLDANTPFVHRMIAFDEVIRDVGKFYFRFTLFLDRQLEFINPDLARRPGQTTYSYLHEIKEIALNELQSKFIDRLSFLHDACRYRTQFVISFLIWVILGFRRGRVGRTSQFVTGICENVSFFESGNNLKFFHEIKFICF